MLELPKVTLFIVDCLDVKRAEEVIRKCTKGINFGAIKLLTNKPTSSPYKVEIGPITSLTEYSAFMIKECWKHVPTEYMQIVQHDGWILNPDKWEKDWYRYDYIGPLFLRETKINNNSVGSGGFSLRSKKLMKFVAENSGPYVPGWGWHGYIHEDGVIAKGMKNLIAKSGFAFAPPDRAARYAYGGNKAMYCENPFGFHGFYALRDLDKEHNDKFLALQVSAKAISLKNKANNV